MPTPKRTKTELILSSIERALPRLLKTAQDFSKLRASGSYALTVKNTHLQRVRNAIIELNAELRAARNDVLAGTFGSREMYEEYKREIARDQRRKLKELKQEES